MNRTQGKGGRRYPGRDGGRKSAKKRPEWQRQAKHFVELVDVPTPHESDVFSSEFRETQSKAMYRFDQEMAKRKLKYHASELTGRLLSGAFEITVSKKDIDSLKAAISSLTE